MNDINETLFEQFGYMFFAGEKVKFNPNLEPTYNTHDWDNRVLFDPIHFKDKTGVVISCDWDLHAFGRGYLYSCEVDFDGIIVKTFAGAFVLYNEH